MSTPRLEPSALSPFAPWRRTLVAGALGLLVAGCCRERSDDGTSPLATSLPPLTLRESTPDLLLTYLDERGDHHTAARVADVPACCRNPVRVVVTTRDEGSTTPLLYVADLTQARGDGTFPVASMPRAKWESLAEEKRSPRVVASGSAGPANPPPPVGAVGKAPVVIYGAAWCGPCHDAQDFLKAHGVPFVYHDIETEPQAQREMQTKLERSGRRGGSIPVIDVGGRVMVGYDPSALRAALKAEYGDRAAL